MKRKELEELGLEKEAIDSVMVLHGKAVSAEKAKYTELQSSVDSLNEQISKRDTDIEALKKSGADSAALQKQLTDLQGKYDADKTAHENLLAGVRKDSAIELAVVKAKARNVKAVQALLDGEKIVLKDGAVSGLEEQLKALKDTDAYLFDTEKAPEPEPETKKPKLVKSGNPSPTPPGETPTWRDQLRANLANSKE